MFLVKSSNDTPGCPLCGGILKYRDSRLRICRKEGGWKEHLMICRLRCSQCGHYHNELPDYLVPHKLYESEVISGVIDGIVSSYDEDSEESPSLQAMLYWSHLFQMNLSNIEGLLHCVGCRILGLGEGISFPIVYDTLNLPQKSVRMPEKKQGNFPNESGTY